jgi:hypothetical protein
MQHFNANLKLLPVGQNWPVSLYFAKLWKGLLNRHRYGLK